MLKGFYIGMYLLMALFCLALFGGMLGSLIIGGTLVYEGNFWGIGVFLLSVPCAIACGVACTYTFKLVGKHVVGF